MNKRFNFIASLLLLACLMLPLVSFAESKPRWVQKGVKALNKERSNDTYEFVNTEAFGVDVNTLRREHLWPLVEKLAKEYALSDKSVKVDTLNAISNSMASSDITDKPKDYRITFMSDSIAVFQVRVVDEYEDFEDFADQTYNWTLYRLYAVSRKNVTPVYDDYTLTHTYGTASTAMSLIPGLGQIYKGHNTKGYVIMGSEAALIGCIIYFSAKEHQYYKKANAGIPVVESWKSKARSWKYMRNISVWLAGGLYAFNLIDAALSKGSRRVVVNEHKGQDMAIVPMVSTEGGGLSFVLRF